LREATRRIEAAEKLQKKLEGQQRVDLKDIFSPVPAYYPDLLELVTRLLRRPQHSTSMLRHLQTARCCAAVKGTPPVSVLLANEYDPVAVKLINDVVVFLTKAAGLENDVRKHVEAVLDAGRGADGIPVEESRDKTSKGPERGKAADQQRLRVE
jgi:hypothetical protein